MGRLLGTNQDQGRLPDELERLKRENTELRFHNLRLLQHLERIRSASMHHVDGTPPILVVIEYKQPGGIA